MEGSAEEVWRRRLSSLRQTLARKRRLQVAGTAPLEQLLNFPEPDIQMAIYDRLDVPAKRRCLAVSKTLRNFILEKGSKWEEEERRHNWMEVKEPVRMALNHGMGVVHTAISEENSSDVYLFSFKWPAVSVTVFREWTKRRRGGVQPTKTIHFHNEGFLTAPSERMAWTNQTTLFAVSTAGRPGGQEDVTMMTFVDKILMKQSRENVVIPGIKMAWLSWMKAPPLQEYGMEWSKLGPPVTFIRKQSKPELGIMRLAEVIRSHLEVIDDPDNPDDLPFFGIRTLFFDDEFYAHVTADRDEVELRRVSDCQLVWTAKMTPSGAKVKDVRLTSNAVLVDVLMPEFDGDDNKLELSVFDIRDGTPSLTFPHTSELDMYLMQTHSSVSLVSFMDSNKVVLFSYRTGWHYTARWEELGINMGDGKGFTFFGGTFLVLVSGEQRSILWDHC